MSHEENQSILESDPHLLLFQSMPDVVTVEQMCMMLGDIIPKRAANYSNRGVSLIFASVGFTEFRN